MVCIERYKDKMTFLTAFNPDVQYLCADNLKRCFMGSAPTLAVVREAFGVATLESWLEIQLRDLSEFSGCKEKLTTEQLDAIARVIFTMFPFLKVTELAYFFLLFKSGKFGKFYGAVDGLKITESLQTFLQIRAAHVAAYMDEERNRQEAEEDARHEKEVERFYDELKWYGITVRQWLDNRDLFNAKDKSREQIKAELDKRLGRTKETDKAIRGDLGALNSLDGKLPINEKKVQQRG